MLPVRRAALGAVGRRGAPTGLRTMVHMDSEYVSPLNGAPRLPSPWNKWFPYEPVPCSPQLAPYQVKCNAGETYNWCACGECRTQPWCEDNGGPNGCRSRGFAAEKYHPRHTGLKLICGCKHCGSKPLTNGTCFLVWADNNVIQASGVAFLSCFAFGLVSTWFAHP